MRPATIRHRRFSAKIPTDIHPFNADFRSYVVAPLVEAHNKHKVPMPVIHEVLYSAISNFVDACAATAVRALPPHADAAGTESEVRLQAWVAVKAFDPNRTPNTWPALLQRRLKVAPADAGRKDDQIPRQLRRFKRAFASSLAKREQELGRYLTPDEKLAIAEEIAPSTSRLNWGQAILHVKSPVATDVLPEQVTDSLTERTALDSELVAEMHATINDLNPPSRDLALRALMACGYVPACSSDEERASLARRIRSAKANGLDDDALERLRECLPLERLQALL